MSTPLLSTSSTSSGNSVGGGGFRSRLGQMGNFVQDKLAGKDDLTVAVEKACYDVAGSPKKKHMDYIIQCVRGHPEQVEEVLLRLNAMTDWSNSVLVTLKVFQCLQLLSKFCYLECNQDIEHQLIFVHEIRKMWMTKAGNGIVDKASLSSLHRLSLLRDFPALSEVVFNQHILSVSQFTEMNRGGKFKLEEVVNFVTKAMALQIDLLSVLRTSIDKSFLSIYNTAERETIHAYRELLQDEVTDLLHGVTCLCNYVQQVDQGSHVNVVLLREELESQLGELRRLRDQSSSQVDASRI